MIENKGHKLKRTRSTGEPCFMSSSLHDQSLIKGVCPLRRPRPDFRVLYRPVTQIFNVPTRSPECNKAVKFRIYPNGVVERIKRGRVYRVVPRVESDSYIPERV